MDGDVGDGFSLLPKWEGGKQGIDEA